MGIINNLLGRFKQEGNFFSRVNYLLGQKGPIWIDTHKPRQLYDEIPQFATVVNKDCSMFSNMELWHVDKEGNRIENSEIEKLLLRPNVEQSMQEFLYQGKQQYNLYGNHFVYKNQATRVAPPVALWNISPAYLQPVLSGKIFDQVRKEDIILKYDYFDNNTGRKSYETKSILWQKRTDPDNPLIGCPIITSLKFPLSNTKAAYEYRNVIMTRKGAIGILANESKDSMGAMPMKPEEKKKIEDNYINKYGIGPEQSSIILTEASLKWQPMTYPTKDLLLFEEVNENMITIADAFGHNINIYSSKNATFENVKNSIIQTYQDAIFPAADMFAQNLTQFLGLQNGEKIVASYEHLAIMKENRQRGMAAIQSIVAALNQAVTAGILKPQQATLILESELGIAA